MDSRRFLPRVPQPVPPVQEPAPAPPPGVQHSKFNWWEFIATVVSAFMFLLFLFAMLGKLYEDNTKLSAKIEQLQQMLIDIRYGLPIARIAPPPPEEEPEVATVTAPPPVRANRIPLPAGSATGVTAPPSDRALRKITPEPVEAEVTTVRPRLPERATKMTVPAPERGPAAPPRTIAPGGE